ncbi:MAG: UPF0272 protein [Isosphaeraceae bacterium]|nr:MAG: UPF0272 protein [Isosphaeraceae bacterium]
MRIAYFDCFSGISGDMTLGALVDAGVDPSLLQATIDQLGIGAQLTFEPVRRAGFRATWARVASPEEHAHRHLHHIEAILDKAALPSRADALARSIFRKIAEAEARVHGSTIEKVHFHEVGAVDSIVDIVGAAVGLDALQLDRIEASPLPPGRGSVQAAHGRMPLPAPGTAELLKGIPLAESTADFEQTTPTGAAILAATASRFGPLPPLTVQSIGYGAGSLDPPGLPNVLRLFIGTWMADSTSDQAWVLETNLDDMTGELIGHVTTTLLAAGALDVFVTPIQMKKNRPGVILTALCDDARWPTIEELILRETTTLGVRRHPVSRRVLPRRAYEVQTELGPIRGKLAWFPSNARHPRFSPEYDDCARIAAERRLPLREVYEAALRAFSTSPPDGPEP